MRALYIHWPFCRKKCPYCDFNSHVRETVDFDMWRKSLLLEMQWIAQKIKSQPISSIFFGGGTPSLMPPNIVEALINQAHTQWGLANDIEITLEANPTSSESDSFKAYRSAGINRLSLGVQALDDKALAFLGREHSSAEALRVVELAASLFPRHSFDLIYARPDQTVENWEAELRAALPYANGHLSLYQLTIEQETPFARLYAKGKFTLPDAHIAAELYGITQDLCAQAGMHAYEVSNYAAADQQSEHNLNYWRGGEYIGIGPGAHGRLRDASGAWFATSTLKSPERWLSSVEEKGHGIEELEYLDEEMRAQEILLGGLRLKEGIPFEKVKRAINAEKLAFLRKEGFVVLNDSQLIVTHSGWLVLERIIAELLQ